MTFGIPEEGKLSKSEIIPSVNDKFIWEYINLGLRQTYVF